MQAPILQNSRARPGEFNQRRHMCLFGTRLLKGLIVVVNPRLLSKIPSSLSLLMQHRNQSSWSGLQRSPRSYPSKVLDISIYDCLVTPETFLARLESFSGRILRAAVHSRADGNGTVPRIGPFVVFTFKVEFLTVDAAAKALDGIQSNLPQLVSAELARDITAQSVPSFALDEEDMLIDIASLHEATENAQFAKSFISRQPLDTRGGELEQRTLAGINRSSIPGADNTSFGHSMEIPLMSRPQSCGSEGGSYSSSSAPSVGSSTGSARTGSFIRRDDALLTHPQGPPNLDYRTISMDNHITLHMADILDDYDDLASEISKFDLNTPTNARGNAPWKEPISTGDWGRISASFSHHDGLAQPYQRPRESFGFSQRLSGELSPRMHFSDWSNTTRDGFTPRIHAPSHRGNGSISANQQQHSEFSRSLNYTPQGTATARSESASYNTHQRNPSTPQRPQHNRDSSYSSIATSQSRHSDHQSYDSKSSSSHSSTSAPEKRSHKKPNQDKRVFAADPHKGPRPTDWMLSEETLKSRAARDARFAQIVAAGLAPGRTKAGWTQARRPGKRDRDAAKAKLRELEEEKERERLRQLLGEDTRSSAPATGVAC